MLPVLGLSHAAQPSRVVCDSCAVHATCLKAEKTEIILLTTRRKNQCPSYAGDEAVDRPSKALSHPAPSIRCGGAGHSLRSVSARSARYTTEDWLPCVAPGLIPKGSRSSCWINWLLLCSDFLLCTHNQSPCSSQQ
jgi:hypothetical protein